MSNEINAAIANFMRGVIRCLFPLLTVGLWVMLLFIDQGRDVLRRIVERVDQDESYSDLVFLCIAASLLALSVWYSMRWLLGVQTPGLWLSGPRVTKPRTWIPRFSGAVVLVYVAVIFCLPGTAPRSDWGRWMAASALTLLSVVLFVFCVYRVKWFRLPVSAGRNADGDPMTLPWRQPLPGPTYRVLLWSLSLTGFGALLVLVFPLSMPRVVGSAALAAIAMASVNLFGSFILTLWPLRRRIPVLAPWVLAGAVLLSTVNDNHASTEVRSANWPGARPTIGQAFGAWLASHPHEQDVYVAATEGGGIRAAYWTAAVLQDLDDSPDLHWRDRLFAISSVSGGSVGAGVWVATVRPRVCGTAPVGASAPLPDAATRALSTDFLSPIIGYMFYLDFAQQFLPFPVNAFDRSHALEGGLQRATDNIPGHPLELSASEFYKDCPKLPTLLLNSTRSDTGQRAILTHLDTADFADIYQSRQQEHPSKQASGNCAPDSSLDHQSMAALMHHSARFPLVSPAGSITDFRERSLPLFGRTVHAHLVDGGYYDNSGIVTAVETLGLMRSWAQKSAKDRVLRYHLIIIDDRPYPECKRGDDGACDDVGDTWTAVTGASPWLHELLPILDGLYNVRDAHVHQAVRIATATANLDVKQISRLAASALAAPRSAAAAWPAAAASGSFDEKDPSTDSSTNGTVEAPLGWSLSRTVMQDIDKQACHSVKIVNAQLTEQTVAPALRCERAI
jgi:hypothetical protein